MVVIQAVDQKVYVHKALLNDEVAAFGECGWSCFPSTTVTNFVEYLYQGDYAPPAALVASSGIPGRWGKIWGGGSCGAGSSDQEGCEEDLPCYAIVDKSMLIHHHPSSQTS